MEQGFSQHGIPENVVSRNRLQYTSKESDNFEVKYRFHDITSILSYQASNGQAEHMIKTVKSQESNRPKLGFLSYSYSSVMVPC